MSTTPIRLAFQDGCAVRFAFAETPRLGFSAPARPSLDFDVGTVVYGNVAEYEGPYEATPTQAAQVFGTERKRMAHDFVVNPIPSHYGLITWNGSTLTVS